MEVGVVFDLVFIEQLAPLGRLHEAKELLILRNLFIILKKASRAWATLIDSILKTKLQFKATTHEPCLYSGNFQGERLLFLRQVDDFAVAANNKEVATNLITAINEQMRIEVKHLGLIDRFNGLDIQQTRYYVKISCEKYL